MMGIVVPETYWVYKKYLQSEHYSSLTAPNLQPAANQERNDWCGNQHHSRELLMMGIVVPETYWFYKEYLQPGHYPSLTAPNLQPTANQERDDWCGNQHYIRELLMMDIVVLEACWTYKKYNKIISGIYLFLFFSPSSFHIWEEARFLFYSLLCFQSRRAKLCDLFFIK